MKRFRNIGIITLTLFSFFYTDKIANLTLEKNSIYQSIEKEAPNYEVEFVDAIIDGDNITPGLTGKVVNIKDSYYNMKDIDTFNSYYLIYDTSYPNVSLDKYKDKVVNRGNLAKRSVAFVLEYSDNTITYFKNNNIPASVLVDINTFKQDEELEQINNEVNNYQELDTLLSKYNINSNICYINNVNEDMCRKNNKYLVKSDINLNNTTFRDIKNNITSGDIYYVEKNTDVKNLNLVISSILYKDLDIVRLSELLSEER